MAETRIPWLRIATEGVVIVASILLALAGDAWWDGRQERYRERALIQGLLDEFENNVGAVNYLNRFHDQIRRAAQAALQTVGSAAPGDTVLVPDSLLALVATGGTYQGPAGVVESAIATGDLALIEDPALRSALAGWEYVVAEAVEEEERELAFVNETLIPVLATSADLRASQEVLAEWIALGPGERGSFEFPDRATRVAVDTRLQSLLSRRVYFARDAIRLSRGALQLGPQRRRFRVWGMMFL